MLTRQRIVFLRKFLCFRFSRSLKVIKRQWARFEPSFAVVDIFKMIFVINLRLHEERRSPAIIWLCLCFSSICLGEISQNFHDLWNEQFCVFFLNLNFWWYNFFSLTGTRKGTNMCNGPANLRKFHWSNKSYSKDSYFLCRKTLRNGIELR